MKVESVFSNVGNNPVTLTEAKAHLRVGNTTEDTMISAMIDGATEWCEQYLGRSLRTATVETLFTNLGSDRVLELPFSPVDEITEIVAVYGDETEVAVTSTQYTVEGLKKKTVTVPWIFSTKELVGYKITYTTTADCPSMVKEAIKKLIAEMWSVRAVSVDTTQGGMAEPTLLSVYKMLDLYRTKTIF